MNKEERQIKFLGQYPNFFESKVYYEKNPKNPKNIKNRSKVVGRSYLKWKIKYPEKVKAHKLVYSAIRNGTLKRKSYFCGNKKSEAHHEDYFKPLKVIWLCKKHHVEADKERREKHPEEKTYRRNLIYKKEVRQTINTIDKKEIHRV